MIFVMLGTQDIAFNRLLDMIDKAIEKGIIKEKVIAQIGCTKYKNNLIETFDFCTKDEMLKYIEQSDVIITHAGVGSIMSALKLNKKVIGCARLSKYSEHINDHQLDILNEFYNNKHILKLDNDIEKVLKEIKTFKPKKYKSNNENFVNKLNEFIGK